MSINGVSKVYLHGFWIYNIDEDALVAPVRERLCVEAIGTMIMNFDNDGIDRYVEMVNELIGRCSYTYR